MLGTKNRTYAKIFAVVMVVLSVFVGAKRSFSSMERKALSEYEKPVKEGAYSTSEYMEQFSTNVSKLIAMSEKYKLYGNDKTFAEIKSANEVISKSSNIRSIATNYNFLVDNINTLYDDLSKVVTGNDKGFLYDNHTDVMSITGYITRSGFNERAAKFNKERKRIPAVFLTRIVGEKDLVVFKEYDTI